jgi:ribonucleotide monophosphatase NagD (HAD superfamily)
VRAAGGVVVSADTEELDAIVVCDDAGYPFLETIEDALSSAVRKLDRGGKVQLVLPNPDLVYPKDARKWGITSGAVAMVIEAGIRRRHPEAPGFVKLGKPHRPIFDEGLRRAAGRSVVMVGDQLETDIAGALAVGIDAALVMTGVGRWSSSATIHPTWLLSGLGS